APAVPDPLAHSLGEAFAACAEAAHRGLLNSPPGLRTRITKAAEDLEKLGLRTTAETVRAFTAALSGDDPHHMTRTWATACVRLLTAAELR
ncbi:hypothetical protein, partial [Actinomadura darangshiensis]|uniref:hypothetical protein n=1 Tax=Actinomadura darangshiensis TaxID=705336 RepID=UPI001A9FAF23